MITPTEAKLLIRWWCAYKLKEKKRPMMPSTIILKKLKAFAKGEF